VNGLIAIPNVEAITQGIVLTGKEIKHKMGKPWGQDESGFSLEDVSYLSCHKIDHESRK